ncbi:hypothetical protein D3C85_945620 [compost metagenome]
MYVNVGPVIGALAALGVPEPFCTVYVNGDLPPPIVTVIVAFGVAVQSSSFVTVPTAVN